VSVKPKILCVPSIYPSDEHQKQRQGCVLLDFCLAKSPASKILSTSDSLLVTIHREGLNDSLRLWSTEDGRCIMTSPVDLFHEKRPKKLYKLSDETFPGIVLCFCEQKEILVINVYTMTLIHVIRGDFEGLELVRVT